MATQTEYSRIRIRLAGVAMALLAVLTTVGERSGWLTSVRVTLHDALSPGRLTLLAVPSFRSGPSVSTTQDYSADDAAHFAAALKDSERQRRQLIIESARLRDQIRRQSHTTEVSALLGSDGIPQSSPLVGFHSVTARVISSQGLPDRLRDLIVDAGRSVGVTRSELVVDGSGLILDQGTEGGTAAGDRVLSGSVVVGRISEAGRWISLVQPVTDVDFTARVQLLRRSVDGLYYGAEGLLRGTGESECVIDGIADTDAVSVGDEVVTSEVSGVRGPRLYFGRVSKADFLDGGQWQIRVQPAVSVPDLDHVRIVRLELHAERRLSPKSPTATTSSAAAQLRSSAGVQ